MQYVDVMIDLETLGTAPGSVILSVGVAASNGSELELTISPLDAMYHGLTVDPSTLAWWRQQDAESWRRSTSGELSLLDALGQLHAWLDALRRQVAPAHTRVWGDGATFDPVLLEAAYRAVGQTEPWGYAEVYCYRTLRQLKDSKKPASKGQHEALADAQAQLSHLKELLK